ncbi:amidohydrolase family protein [Thalassotalea sp. HSM 43]|uniref:metal-dependent hydrolase family protein n=1 Tax=Thalassotalea sp. HSM 43 TaxID=2552945 RepID=UPI00108137AB|nr:amidohydrolase family protein [Thalassotalea sp. HSM 43]QBY05425.1 amidohydrolase family protein [Thalassotalea sp. HSM 43]
MPINNKKLLALFALMPLSTMAADYKILHAGKVLPVPGKTVLSQQSIVIKDNQIDAILPGYITKSEVDKDAEVIDLKDKFIMPGLMDMHVHIQFELGPNNDSETLKLSAEDVAMRSVYFAEKTLQSGFTTVRDLGANPQPLYALRDGINKGWVEGPRIVASGGVSVTGGHGDVDGMRHDLLEKYTSKTICDGPYDCRGATRNAIKYGADVIKITSTGGVLSDTNTGTGQQMADDEIKEIVDAAHALGRKVASHAHAAAGINAALRAGVDSIEHGSYADEDSIQLFKYSGAYLVPTLLAGDTVLKMAETSDFMSDAIRAKARRVGADMIANFSRAYENGVNIAFGTDSGVSSHGNNAYEAVLMYNAGMAPMDILKSATINAADLIDKSSQLGTLEQGKFADIIAMDDNPLKDISALQRVSFVMKDGKVFKHNL